ncbi:MAG: TetR/AcrR family transcriptional regulator [Alphaproteobacteria bacterium]|nr:TetR/AcrR family transcriptional regulator [Alphaproteobacteria bacterium]
MKRGEARERILDAGESLVRQHGLNGVSFRDLADQVGVKSASVHYHFPTKDDFLLVLSQRYCRRFLSAAEEALSTGASVPDKVRGYSNLFLTAFAQDGRMCLCGILAAEAADLADPVRKEIATFFDANIGLLKGVLGDASEARFVLTSLEGAMLMARVEKSPQHLESTARDLVDRYRRKG